MSKGVSDLLNALTQSERDRAEYNAQLEPQEATMSDDEAEFLDVMIERLVSSEHKAQIDSGFSCLAFSMGKIAHGYKRKGGTEAQTEKYLREFYLGAYLTTLAPVPDEPGRLFKKPVLIDEEAPLPGNWAKATAADVDTAIAEIKEAGGWPWEVVVIM